MKETIIVKVSSKSEPTKVAGSIIAFFKEGKNVEVQGIGAGAVNQAVKGIATARGYIAPEGINLVCIPAFANAEVEGEDRTAIKFIIKEEN